MNMPYPRFLRRPAAAGFTMIELMVTLGIAAVITSIGTPSFRLLLDGNRIAGEINSLAGDLQFARSEAIKRGLSVSLCVSADGATCVDDNKWHRGWIVRSEADDSVLRVRNGWSASDTLVATPSLAIVTFNRDGFAMNLGGGTVTLPLRASSGNTAVTRCLALNVVGRQAMQKHGTGSCT